MNAGRAFDWAEHALVTVAEACVMAGLLLMLGLIAAVDMVLGNRWEDDL